MCVQHLRHYALNNRIPPSTPHRGRSWNAIVQHLDSPAPTAWLAVPFRSTSVAGNSKSMWLSHFDDIRPASICSTGVEQAIRAIDYCRQRHNPSPLTKPIYSTRIQSMATPMNSVTTCSLNESATHMRMKIQARSMYLLTSLAKVGSSMDPQTHLSRGELAEQGCSLEKSLLVMGVAKSVYFHNAPQYWLFAWLHST